MALSKANFTDGFNFADGLTKSGKSGTRRFLLSHKGQDKDGKNVQKGEASLEEVLYKFLLR